MLLLVSTGYSRNYFSLSRIAQSIKFSTISNTLYLSIGNMCVCAKKTHSIVFQQQFCNNIRKFELGFLCCTTKLKLPNLLSLFYCFAIPLYFDVIVWFFLEDSYFDLYSCDVWKYRCVYKCPSQQPNNGEWKSN